MPPNDQPPVGPDYPSAWLVIPYFDDDLGRPLVERPLTDDKAISWACPSIVVDGTPGIFGFERGQPVSVSVSVANHGWGGLAALVRVSLWWADPTIGFAAAHPFGETNVLVPADGTPVASPLVTNTIPPTAPPHVCLLARATTTLDGTAAGSAPDPVNDRHWAQANLTEAVAAEDGAFDLAFDVANPFETATQARLRAAPLSESETGILRRILDADARTGLPEDLRLLDAEGRDLTETAVDLRAKETMRVTLRGRMPEAGRRGTFFKLVQSLGGDPRAPEMTGTLGVRITGG
jgi:hypothetical protein